VCLPLVPISPSFRARFRVVINTPSWRFPFSFLKRFFPPSFFFSPRASPEISSPSVIYSKCMQLISPGGKFFFALFPASLFSHKRSDLAGGRPFPFFSLGREIGYSCSLHLSSCRDQPGFSILLRTASHSPLVASPSLFIFC